MLFDRHVHSTRYKYDVKEYVNLPIKKKLNSTSPFVYYI